MRQLIWFGIVFVGFGTTAARAIDYRAEAVSEAPPKEELSEAIAGQLNDQAVHVIRGTKTTLCHIWLCKEWPVASAEPGSGLLYPFQPGQLIGVATFGRKSSDFRDQDISKGVYTLRYSQQPIDGNHVGTSITRDFLLLVNAEQDTEAKPLDYEPLMERSAEAAESNHPAMLSLQAQPSENGEAGDMREDEERDWWLVRLHGTIRVGDKTQKMPLELVIVGEAIE